jgi:hypothetical protein
MAGLIPDEAIERFIATGEYDPHFPELQGDAIARRDQGFAVFRTVLRRIVRWRTNSARGPAQRLPLDPPGAIRARLGPMLDGLFDPAEATILAAALPVRFCIVTAASFDACIERVSLRTAWDLANLLLDDIGAPPLADDTPALDGLCEAGHAWVLPRAFCDDGAVLVHEAAHLLHALDRATVGLVGPGPILNIPPRRRETFAYTCERIACGALRPIEDARVDLPTLDRLVAEGWRPTRTWAERPPSTK